MIHPAYADIIPFLAHTVAALRPFAATHGVQLDFESSKQGLTVWYEPKKLMDQLAQLICEMISLMPGGSRIHLAVTKEQNVVCISLQNDGIDLSRIGEMIGAGKNGMQVLGTGTGTEIRFQIPLGSPSVTHNPPDQRIPLSAQWRGFYGLIKNRLRSHFSKAENLVALLSQRHPKDAAFLQKVNQLIQANMEDETFDSAALGRYLHLSRTQLFRKLKPLIRQAPAQYIRVMRLEKAKELLETSDLNIGEVTFKTGFQSQSHFTKAFTQHYGVAPSLFRRKATK